MSRRTLPISLMDLQYEIIDRLREQARALREQADVLTALSLRWERELTQPPDDEFDRVEIEEE